MKSDRNKYEIENVDIFQVKHVVAHNFVEFFEFRSPVEDGDKIQHNSTQTPSDLSPPAPCTEEYLPQAHHQNPGHCIASFSTINRMRLNTQVSQTLKTQLS